MLPAILLLACVSASWVAAAEGRSFHRTATFPVCKQYEPSCNTDRETVAEIVVASDDGNTPGVQRRRERRRGLRRHHGPRCPRRPGAAGPRGRGHLGEHGPQQLRRRRHQHVPGLRLHLRRAQGVRHHDEERPAHHRPRGPARLRGHQPSLHADLKAEVIEEVVVLDDDVNGMQSGYGFEGVAVDGDHVVVAFQRAWGGESHPRLGVYSTVSRSWKFVFYPLGAPASQNGGWVGLSDISALGGGRFLVLEADNQFGPDASVKRIYAVSLGDLGGLAPGSTVSKEPLLDLMPALESKNGLVVEKVAGLAVTCGGSVWVVNDSEGVDDSSGETLLLSLGDLAVTPSTVTCARAKQAYRQSQCCGNPGGRFRT